MHGVQATALVLVLWTHDKLHFHSFMVFLLTLLCYAGTSLVLEVLLPQLDIQNLRQEPVADFTSCREHG